MTRSHSFSIYLLKEDYSVEKALDSEHQVKLKEVQASEVPAGSRVFIQDTPPAKPWWKDYFGITENLLQSHKGALVFFPVHGRWFVLCFGHAYHNLDDSSFVYDLGLRVTLNSVDSERLQSTHTLEIGPDRRQVTQVPAPSDLTFFDLDHDVTILRSLTGKVKKQYEDFFRNSSGSSSLHITSKFRAEELVGLCENLLEIYNLDDYKTIFPRIWNIAPVNDPRKIRKLDKKLLKAFRAESDNLNLSVPDIVNYDENLEVTFTKCGKGLRYPDANIESYYRHLRHRKCDKKSLQIDDLKAHKLQFVDDNKKPRGKAYSIYRCFIYDVPLENGGEAFHFVEGNWYKVEDDYMKKLTTELDRRYKAISLPEYSHNNENEYNKSVPQGREDLLCFDKADISPEGQRQVEPCDLYKVNGQEVVFIHVKISTRSSGLSHLFSQGAVAVELLLSEGESLAKMKELIDGKDLTPEEKEKFKAPLDAKNYEVVFAIVTNKDPNKKSLNLPLFSRINLLRYLKALERMRIPACYGFITMRDTKMRPARP